MPKLNRNHPEPLYRQLITAILQQIATDQIVPGEDLPSTRQLEQIYGVSSITVRRALTTLQQQGYVHSVPGKGTFVTYARIGKPLRTRASFSRDMRRHGIEPSSVVLRAEIVAAEGQIAKELCLSVGAEVVLLERVRLGNGIPMCVQICYFPHCLCPGALRYDFTKVSMYQVLQETYRLEMGRSEYCIRAALAGERQLLVLGVSHPAVVLWIEGRNYLASGQVFEYAKTAYRADRYEVRTSWAGGVSIDIQDQTR